jgi:hypothetical protein
LDARGYRDPSQRAASSALSLFVIDPPVRLHNRRRRAALRLRAALLFLGGFPPARERQLTNARLGLPVLERAGFFFGVGARFFGAGSGATMAKISRSAASQ